MGTRNLIVTDIAIQPFRENRVFEPDFAKQFPGAMVYSTLKKVASNHDWGIMTGDVFLTRKPDFKRAVCLSNEATPELTKILRLGVEPGLLISCESPNVAWSFYHNLPQLSKGFHHACLFRGVAEQVHPGSQFHTHYWPMSDHVATSNVDFEKRRLLAMVCSFKERLAVNYSRLASRIMVPLKWAKILWYQTINSSARFSDLYEKRLEAIARFASQEDFYLYGRGWDVARKHVRRVKDIQFVNAPIACKHKIETLSSFRFNLVMENCIFPGYVTEKIFDAMLAGTVPVYLGAPDIEDFVPRECFVDFRQYSGFDDLWDDMLSCPEKRWLDTIRAIRGFLASTQCDRFREETVANNWFKWLTEDTGKSLHAGMCQQHRQVAFL